MLKHDIKDVKEDLSDLTTKKARGGSFWANEHVLPRLVFPSKRRLFQYLCLLYEYFISYSECPRCADGYAEGRRDAKLRPSLEEL